MPPWGGRDLFRAHHAGHVALTATGRGGVLFRWASSLGPNFPYPNLVAGVGPPMGRGLGGCW